MHLVPIVSQDHLGMLKSHLYCYAIQNGTLNTQQSNEMSFGCVHEIVTLVLVTVIIVYV